jgi:hypothetical protein
MGKIVRDRYPQLSESDQEAVRQHAVAALNITQQAKRELADVRTRGDSEDKGNLALIYGVRKFVNVRDLDIDLIDRINPFDAAYAILARAMNEATLKQVQATIAAKRITIDRDEAMELTQRAMQFLRERGRSPDINANDPWEQRMAEGVAALARYRKQERAAEHSEGDA